MAVSYVSASSAYGASATPTTATVTAPANIANGDILVAYTLSVDSGGYMAVTPPAGFSSWGSNQQATGRRDEVFWKRASSESGDYAFTAGNDCDYLLVSIVVLRGCLASGNPLDVISNTAYVTSNTTIRAASMTTTTEGGQVWMGRVRTSPNTITVPAAFSAASNTTTEFWRIATAYRVDAEGQTWGETGTQDGTSTESSSKHAMMVSVKVAEEPATTFLPHVMSHHFIPQQLGGH